MHEDALVGFSSRAAYQLGAFDQYGKYRAKPSNTNEYDFEHSLVVAARIMARGQVALLVPFVQTYRETRRASEFGGGLGDINFSARFDPLRAHEARYVPGIAILVGLTLPTGTAPEAANKPLTTDATGVGAMQGNLGLALEQAFGPWMLGLAGIMAWRSPRTFNTVQFQASPLWTGLATARYAFNSGLVFGGSLSYSSEGNAEVNGRRVNHSARHLLTCSLSGMIPINDTWRATTAIALTPPWDELSANQLASLGVTLGTVWSYP